MKSDWRFCAWCYGAAIGPTSERTYPDRRYKARCGNKRCTRRDLMPFMRYCPWCNAKVKRAWKILNVRDRCHGCGWGVLREFWEHCPWCSKSLGAKKG